VIDSLPVPIRVAAACLVPGIALPISGSLKPQYHDEHGSKAIDSNLLFMLAAKCFQKFNPKWFSDNEVEISGLIDYYDSMLDSDGLIVQPAFSDWQDSAKRLGKTAYTNFLYCCVLDKYQDQRFKNAFKNFMTVFYDSDSGMFRSLQNQKYFSLDVQLFAMMSDFVFENTDAIVPQNIFDSVKRSQLWSGIATVPNYPSSDLSLAVRLAGNQNYHGSMIWTWLVALQAQAAHRTKNFADRDERLQFLTTQSQNTGVITEIIDSETLLPFRSLLYRSEQPFSWGAAMTVWVLGAIENKNINFL
jgi:hypothetical protein